MTKDINDRLGNPQSVEIQISLHYKNQSPTPIEGRLQPTKETVMRDLYDMLKNGTIPYKEIRTTEK